MFPKKTTDKKSLKKTTDKKSSKKHDWLISSGDIELGVYYANVISNLTEYELGSHIRNNIDDLYDHFSFVASITATDDTEKIGKIMHDLFKKYGDGFMEPATEKKLDKMCELIKNNLKNFSNLEIISELNYFGSLHEALFVRIRKLNRKTKYLIVYGDDS